MFISPMLLSQTDNPFDDHDYLAELKLDGIRLMLSTVGGSVKLFTRFKTDVTHRFPELHSLQLPKGIILDGEIVLTDDQGKPDYEAVQTRLLNSNDNRMISYCAFDVLYYNGKSVVQLSLIERKALLNELIPEDSPLLSKVLSVENSGIALFELCRIHDLEGIVMKHKDSRYEINKRSQAWLKVLNYSYEDVWIKGYRKDKKSLLVSFENGDTAGLLENGVTSKIMNEVYQNTAHLKNHLDRDVVLFDAPPLKCRVKYTKSRKMREPQFIEFVT
ncbi:RNA ligase family protein [Bacillus suaedae]|uniref:ATP-dependent DNA ligase n=1 Tax=Halalkalibacter suaedae TaxID=2822140 RepID=A0A940WTL7_9BACI|nr:RNA ligase family protein [Bacillus suaedae]MBP3952250.1 ATP-dependent DNA ligase [Bacillus suaedae]